MPLPTRCLALRVHRYAKGSPWEGVSVDSVEVPTLQSQQCMVAMLYTPIHPADLSVMQGINSRQPMELPSVVGVEGCGQIIAVAEDVPGFGVGDIVVSRHWGWGSFAQYITVPFQVLIKVPNSVPRQVACMLSVTPPLAYGLLRCLVQASEFSGRFWAPASPAMLQPLEESGERNANSTSFKNPHHNGGSVWIIQNAANGSCGLSVVQLAKRVGLNVVNIVRHSKAAELVKAHGGEHVIVYPPSTSASPADTDPSPKQQQQSQTLVELVRQATNGAPIKMALDGVGGHSTRELLRCLSNGGTLLTYAALSGEPAVIPTPLLITRDLRIRGFSLDRFEQTSTPEELAEMWELLFEMSAQGTFRLPTEQVCKLGEGALAVVVAAQEQRGGKVVLEY